MKQVSTAAEIVALGLETAWENVAASFERFCLTAGIATLSEMMEQDAIELCGVRHGRSVDRRGYRWGGTMGRLGFHGGKVAIERPRVRARNGAEMAIPSWEAAQAEDWLGRWAMNLMLINVSTRRFRRAVRLPEGDIAAPPGAGVSKSAVSRRFVALSAERGRCQAFLQAPAARAEIQAAAPRHGRSAQLWSRSPSGTSGRPASDQQVLE